MSFIERTIALFVNQLGVFSNNIKGKLGTTLGFSLAKIKQAEDDYLYAQWVLKCLDSIEAYHSSYVAYLRLVRYGAKGVSVIVEPEMPVFDTPPLIVLAGIQSRFSANAKEIKANPACTLDMQKFLGIAPVESALPKEDEVPDLKAKESAGYPVVSFHKYDNEGLSLYRDKGDGKGYGTAPFKTLFYSPYIDKDVPAVGQTALYKYKGIYLDHDVETGKFSPEVSVTVVGR